MRGVISAVKAMLKKHLAAYRSHRSGLHLIPALYNVDMPSSSRIDTKYITIEGWIIPNEKYHVKRLRARFGNNESQLKYGSKRADVARVYTDLTKAVHSGFSGLIDVGDISEDILYIDVDLGYGFQLLYKKEMRYSPELLVADIYNPKFAEHMAEHINLLENKRSLFYEEPLQYQYERADNDPRVIAFYLPQFHPITENDKVWGKNFTEWTNVTSDVPRFIGHQQPILPSDTGFYDLRLEQNMQDQIERAKKHGLYGFCFYYYWFSGKCILDTPLHTFLKHKKWDFNFTICWANENWTKRWDGRDNEVIIAQQYHDDDPLKFIMEVEDILLDPRYITENGNPVLLVFRASELKDPSGYACVWREYFRNKHNKGLHLVSIVSFEDKDPREYGFDAAVDFAPQSSFFKNDAFDDHKYPHVDVRDRLLDVNFTGVVADYRKIALNDKTYDYFDFPAYACVTPSWDNDARKKGKGFVMVNENPDIYYRWFDNVLKRETAKTTSPIVFINAWNEWAEGAVLEPTRHYGSAVLNRTTEALSKYSAHPKNRVHFPAASIRRRKTAKLAVVLHLYYEERWNYIKEKLKLITEDDYDLFVTLSAKNTDFASEIRKTYPEAYIRTVPNRGRDILPFIFLLSRLKEAGYIAVLKLHSKKTTHRDNGSDWFDSLLENLLPNKTYVSQAIQRATSFTTIIGPSEHFISLKRYMGSNRPHLERLLLGMVGMKNTNVIMQNADECGYFAGSMFWANMEALEPLANLYLTPEDFESEKAQIDGTIAHAIERVISVQAFTKNSDIRLLEIDAGGIRDVGKPVEQYDFAD